MKTKILSLAFAFALTPHLFAAESLHLRLEPESRLILSGAPQEIIVKIDLAATPRKTSRRTALNLSVVLDRSGSMTGAKIEKARQAAIQLVDQLAPDDVFSLVAYSSTVQVLVPAQRVEDKELVRRQIARLEPGGSTALYAGVNAGAEELSRFFSARRVNRVILLSDGLANVGPKSTGELRQLGGRLAQRGIAVTTIGVGDDYNEDLMAGLAEASDANYYYVKDTEKLPEIFAKELGELMAITARDVRIEITCPRGVRPLGFLGRPETFEGQRAVVRLNSIAAGQSRPVYLRCRVEDPTGAVSRELASVRVEYLDEQEGGRARSVDGEAAVEVSASAPAVAASINRSVQAEKALLITAEVKDQALGYADQGDYKKAGETFRTQAIQLDAAISCAPVALRPRLEQEQQLLQQRAADFERGDYDPGSRKMIQSESWTVRNSKQ